MSVLGSKALHEQLSVIMSALSRAAVAEISAAVDEGYAALRAELQRSRRENRELREKLHLIEAIVIRGSCSGEPPVPVPAEGGAQPAWRAEGGASAEREEVVAEPRVGLQLPEVVLIKDEDEDGGPAQEEAEPREQRSDPGEAEAAAAAAVGGACGRRHQSSLVSPDSPHSEPGRGAEEMEAGESACSYASQVDADLHSEQQDHQPLGGHAYFGGGGGLTESCSDLGLGLGLDPGLIWNKAQKNPAAFPQFHQSEDGDAFGLKMLDVSGATPTDSGGGSALEYGDGAVMDFALNRDQLDRDAAPARRSRRFVCSVCSKTYATSQNLEVHMRIHTGQKPFSCDHCGKKFTQSAHLKSHLTIHSGERPHACSLCGRSFIAKYSLELHMARQHAAT